MASRKVTIELIVDGKGAVKGVKQVDGSVQKLDRTLDETGKGASKFKRIFQQAFAFASVAAATAAIKSFARFVRESLSLTKTQEIAERKLATALKNTGEEVENNSRLLIEQAAALQKVSNFGDEVIINAQAFLLTVKESAGPQGVSLLTPRLLDMASAIAKTAGEQVDLMTVTRAVGRALGGEIGGLSRYGVFLTEIEESALKAASGVERVKIVTEILDSRFKGLAEATRDPFQQLQNAVGDLREEFARGLLPVIEKIVSRFVDFAGSKEVQQWARDVGEAIGFAIEEGFQWLIDHREDLEDFAGSVAELAITTFDLVGSLNSLADGVTALLGDDEDGKSLTALGFVAKELVELMDDLSTGLLLVSGFFRLLGKTAEEQAPIFREMKEVLGLIAEVGFIGPPSPFGVQPIPSGVEVGAPRRPPSSTAKPGPAQKLLAGGDFDTLFPALKQDTQDFLKDFNKKFDLVDDRGVNNAQALIDLMVMIAAKTKEAEVNIERERDLKREIAVTGALAASARLDELNAEQNAIAGIILALEEEKAARASLLGQQLAADIRGVKSRKDAFNAIRRTILNEIEAWLALTIAKSIASTAEAGPFALILAPILAASMRAIFESLVPSFTHGVTGFGGGLALVGERGPELVTLGQGSNVLTNENTQRVLSAGSNMVVAELKLLRREMRELQVFVNWQDFQRAQQQAALLAQRTGRT